MIYFQIIFLNNHRISTYIDIMPSHSEGVWFGCILWHINYSWLFNAKLSSYVYIRYIWFGMVVFYGISTIVGYLMPNPLYTYILNI